MIYGAKMFIAIIVILASVANAFRMQASNRNDFSLRMALKDFKEELAKTAATIAGPGKVSIILRSPWDLRILILFFFL